MASTYTRKAKAVAPVVTNHGAVKAFVPSPQQAAVLNWVVNGTGNAFVQAVAGAGKTTTIIQAAKKMQGKILLVAFNTTIKNELAAKLVEHKLDNAEARNFNSLGNSAWKAFTNAKFVNVKADKMKYIFNDMQIPNGYFSFVVKLVGHAKQAGIGCVDAIGPHMDINNDDNWNDIIAKHDLGSDLPQTKDFSVDQGIAHAKAALRISNKNWDMIDFNDQVYLPVLNNITMPMQYDWILVDESQDTNDMRRTFARMLTKPTTRMLWVGDERQAIYGFTGADSDAVARIIKEFNCIELPLTVTYRCPKAVVKFSQTYVSHIEAHESAPEGEVKDMSREDFDKLETFAPVQDAILCRKNAPLVEAAYRLIRLGVPCQIEGRSDLGKSILAMVDKWKRVKTLADFIDKLDDWLAREIEKLTEKNGQIKKNKEIRIEQLQDRVATMKALCDGCKDLECVRNKVETMFADTKEGEKPNRVILSSVHKAKGKEWNNVYILGFHEYMPSPMAKQEWQKVQETNLIYVACTRAQSTLTLVG